LGRHHASVTPISDILTVADPTERAKLADSMLWDGQRDARTLRTLRGDAIREAIDEGRAPQEIADLLNVRVSDLTWMTGRSAAPAP
jgi:hypothetical protein